ncbi:CsgG/HfaB family protein (plasmid) [Limimaricola variabilis]|uniref:CsgG/HfaB family protein n=1 Tax=Limimaricola variabilis TaxID=1492771 RepID=UPI002AC9ED2B|nr:CsgG/HfaB family protein [Limimaricola variabilis]WPY96263.1 CsgG/HfaB family protein [Limimaricola variabilis]
MNLIMRLRGWQLLAAACVSFSLAGCAVSDLDSAGTSRDPNATDPGFSPTSRVGASLIALPAPTKKIDVAVYKYADETGKNEAQDNFSSFSRAVSQGNAAILIDVLTEAGAGKWFNVVERVGLQNLLTERQLIEQTNQNYLGTPSPQLPPLRFAGIMLEGGIVDYESNVLTGGAGARILGIGGSHEYRRDRVAVALRAVSVSTGEVLSSVQTEKFIYSFMQQGSIFRYVATDQILEAESGFSQNEPTGLAVRQAIELAVFALIVEGAEDGLWSFSDPAYQNELVSLYRLRKAQSAGSPAQILATVRAEQAAADDV